jgi:hypothetical protein
MFYLFIPRDGSKIYRLEDDYSYGKIVTKKVLKLLYEEVRIIKMSITGYTDWDLKFYEFDGERWIDVEEI